jgi:ABC-2 type transport system ATP-binding protein
VVQLDRLTRRYGRRRGVEQIDLSVSGGSLFGFLGPNGAGKTTTIRVLLGFLRPTAGRARVFELDCWRDSAKLKTDVGYLPGDLRLYPWMTPTSALRIVSAARRVDLMSAGLELAERFALDPKVRVRSMSRGTRQKLGLILALAHRPRLLVLDEPTSSLDPLMQQELRTHLRELAAGGTTVFLSSHTLGEVEQLCDRVAVVRDGRIVADEPLDALRRRAGHQVVIRWKDPRLAASLQPPTILNLTRRDEAIWHGVLDGPVEEFIRWLAPHPVDDLVMERPDLETLFRRFYRPEAP